MYSHQALTQIPVSNSPDPHLPLPHQSSIIK
ncbi:hypothetical protein SVI_3024 [Shewanella violacea DSS12]|uniref:Uncharacterized protein n=1 Tax=Shewanella violacea (strain JCM 10179 / CIP 106290 / LMG 19151 / DSS12) TaxID=637905 RepID=D4ZAF0_SHEVD|nr:hypothetical protein SVI_3024 [Shewanella violacea DSS12]